MFRDSARPMVPNVVMIVLDDVGFAQLGCFGSDIRTPNIDLLAARGLRYSRFHVTGLCSPTRACLLTGRNAHAVGMGSLSELTLRYPGYSARIPRSAATLPRVLRDAGYATLGIGKWHQTPGDSQTAAGPFDRWPLGLGFERFYGFLHGETNHWSPQLVCDNHFVDPPRTVQQGYHLTEDLAETAIRYVYDVLHSAPGKPFFLYFATGATHAPHHVPRSWVQQYAGAFDDGWDTWRQRAFARQRELGLVPEGTILTARPPWIEAWQDLTPDRQHSYARMHEVYAGFLAHTDAQIGRLLAALGSAGVLDDTLVLLLSDNGASSEGGPEGTFNHRSGQTERDWDPGQLDGWGDDRGYVHYPWGWAWAGNCPFRLWKRYSWLGGTRTPLVIAWPDRIAARGEIRHQFCHAIDLAPTVLECCGVEPPDSVDGVEQQKIDGVSIAATFDRPAAPDPRRVQYFEVIGSRSIYAYGWKATTDHVGRSNAWERRLLDGSRSFDDDRWELFHLETDASEAIDVADENPELLRRLQELWVAEARRNNVLPIDDATHTRDREAFVPSPYPPRAHSVFRAGGGPIAESAVPSLAHGGRITANVEIPEAGAEGMLCAMGDWSSGLALYVRGVELVFRVSAQGRKFGLRGEIRGIHGPRRLGCATRPLRPGGTSFALLMDDRPIAVGQADLVPAGFWGTTLCIGYDRGLPVHPEYTAPFRWSGVLHSVEIDVPGAPGWDARAVTEAALRSE